MPVPTSLAPKQTKLNRAMLIVIVVVLLCLGYSFPFLYNRVSDGVQGVLGVSIGHLTPPPFRLGLDLRGGTALTYEVDAKAIAPSEQASAVEGARDVIERRVNAFGVGEPLVETIKSSDRWRVFVELPDIHDVQKAIDMIGATPILEFRDKKGGEVVLDQEQKKQQEESNRTAKKRADEAVAKLRTGKKFNDLYAEYLGESIAQLTKSDDAALFAWAQRRGAGAITRDLIESPRAWMLAERGAASAVQTIAARHIVICYAGIGSCPSTLTKEEALQKAKDLSLKVTAQNFADLAKVNSMDPGSTSKGGDLGWFGRGMFVKNFDDAVFNPKLKKGGIVGPIETEYGYHLIYKYDEKFDPAFAVRVISFKKTSVEDIFGDTSEWKPTGLSGKQLERARVDFDQNTGEPTVSVTFNAEGKELFAKITQRNVGEQVAIYLDRQIISAPVVREPITDGTAIISGNFTLESAKQLAERLNAGALPLPVSLVSQQTVGATLGSASLAQSTRAGLIGFVLVLLFLAAWYRLPGLLAALALLVYVVLVLAVFKFIPVTLTLAGIAGFILSMGMAVDANVLVFERTREELALGRSPLAALEEAFPRAWSSIRDSNASSLITCVILYWFGSSVVRGFALTLAIGILASLFTAITVTRLLLRITAPYFGRHRALFIPSNTSSLPRV